MDGECIIDIVILLRSPPGRTYVWCIILEQRTAKCGFLSNQFSVISDRRRRLHGAIVLITAKKIAGATPHRR